MIFPIMATEPLPKLAGKYCIIIFNICENFCIFFYRQMEVHHKRPYFIFWQWISHVRAYLFPPTKMPINNSVFFNLCKKFCMFFLSPNGSASKLKPYCNMLSTMNCLRKSLFVSPKWWCNTRKLKWRKCVKVEAILQYAFDDELHKKEHYASSVFNKWEPVFSQMI